MWKLVIEDDEGKRTVVPLTRDEYTIGRKEGNSIRLTERNVSRDHAKVSRRPGATKEKPIFTLGDLTSYNGVYVNGLRVVDKQDLSHGDLIQIGDYRIVLQDELADAQDVPDDGAVSIDPDDLKETVQTGPVIPIALRATNATFLEKPNRLVVLAGPNPGEEFPLVGERFTIGRAEDATISVNHNSVSRLHCEVHALGDARFEIVDKGSSNGVRVNGADLRRGIIEAGDVIELGDVKFKFVGEGQLFRPGNESQQLAAISPRTATEASSGKRSPVLPIALVLALLTAAGGAFFYMKGSKPPPDTPTPEVSAAVPAPDNTGADIAMLADAHRMADIGDVEGAHAKANSLAPGSPLHTSADFMYIELKWGTMLLFQADAETDPATKTNILQRVMNDAFVDAVLKKTAAARLAAVETAKDAGKKGAKVGVGVGATPTPLAVAPPPRPEPTPQVVPQVAPPPPPPPRPAAPSVADLMTSGNPADMQKARTILEGRVFGHHGTPDEIRKLKSICKTEHDQGCVDAVNAEANR